MQTLEFRACCFWRLKLNLRGKEHTRRYKREKKGRERKGGEGRGEICLHSDFILLGTLGIWMMLTHSKVELPHLMDKVSNQLHQLSGILNPANLTPKMNHHRGVQTIISHVPKPMSLYSWSHGPSVLSPLQCSYMTEFMWVCTMELWPCLTQRRHLRG